MEDRLLTLSQLAKYLNISRRTVYRVLKDSSLPAYRVGKHRRFKMSDIDKWLNDIKEIEGAKED